MSGFNHRPQLYNHHAAFRYASRLLPLVPCSLCSAPFLLKRSTPASTKSGKSFTKSHMVALQIVTDRMLFHDECAIYPAGFCSTRVFAGMKSPDQQCLYTCQIKDVGAGPQVHTPFLVP